MDGAEGSRDRMGGGNLGESSGVRGGNPVEGSGGAAGECKAFGIREMHSRVKIPAEGLALENSRGKGPPVQATMLRNAFPFLTVAIFTIYDDHQKNS